MDGVGGELWLIDRDLSTSYKVLDGPLDDVSQLHWAPDSASLAVVIGRSHVQEHYSFRIIRIASFQGRSTDAVFLPELCSEVSLVQWCPEGRYLLAVISYDPREYEDDENAAHMRLLMADLAPVWIRITVWVQLDRRKFDLGRLERAAIWDKQSGWWHVLLPGASLLLTLDAGKQLGAPEDVTVSSVNQQCHASHVSPSGLILAKIVPRVAQRGRSSTCMHHLCSSSLVERNDRYLPHLLAGGYMQAVTWKPHRSHVYACTLQTGHFNSPTAWHGQEVCFLDGISGEMVGSWHINSSADNHDCGGLMDLSWSPGGTCLCVNCSSMLFFLSFA